MRNAVKNARRTMCSEVLARAGRQDAKRGIFPERCGLPRRNPGAAGTTSRRGGTSASVAAQTYDNMRCSRKSSETMITRFPNASGWLSLACKWRSQPQNQTAQGAEDDLQTAIKKNPKDSAALVSLGEIRFRQKRLPEGVQLMQQALDADPNQLPALQMLVGYYMYQHQPDKAIALIQQLISRTPNNSSLYVELSDVQLANKDTSGALTSAQKAMQMNPSDGSAVMAYTRASTASGNTGAAIAKWQQWNTAHPNDARGNVILGTLEEGRGNATAAIDYYKKALAIQPDQPVAQNNLAFLMLQNGQDVDMALSLAESARRSMPHSTNTADTLAWAYYYKGIYGSARDLLEDALKTNPNDASIQYHLGMVYSKMGNKANAVDHLKKAASLAPGTQTGNDATKALSSLT